MILRRVWQGKGYFCVSTKDSRGKWRDHFFTENELSKVPKFLQEHKDDDVYFAPNAFKIKARDEKQVIWGNWLYADLDEADPRACKIKPTIAIESSPGRYVGLWQIDKPGNVELNKRLTYFLDADRSGWDATQVLRVIGTYNHKYTNSPRVRTLWLDGPVHTVQGIERSLPRAQVNGHDHGAAMASDASEVYDRVENLLKPRTRKELISGKPTVGHRSDMMFRLQAEMLEAGVARDDAFVLIKASPWNKFKGRKDEDKRLKEELKKHINRHINGAKPQINGKDVGGLEFKTMDKVQEENIDWIYYPYFARGEVTIVEGNPGSGKSYLVQMIAGGICDGDKLKSVKPRRVQGKVVFFDVENSSGSVTKKRLLANGFEHLENYMQCETPFSIDDEELFTKIMGYLEDVHPAMIVFDTVQSFTGGADAHKAFEIQQTLGKFRELAQTLNCAVCIVRHLTKSSKERALFRGQGSIAFAGLARIVISVGCMPDDPETRAFAVAKINNAKTPPAMTFYIKQLPDTLQDFDRSEFEWGDWVPLDADEILAKPEKGNNDREQVKEFLQTELEDTDEVELQQLERMAEARALKVKLLKQVADELGVKKRVVGKGKDKVEHWSLGA